VAKESQEMAVKYSHSRYLKTSLIRQMNSGWGCVTLHVPLLRVTEQRSRAEARNSRLDRGGHWWKDQQVGNVRKSSQRRRPSVQVSFN